MSEPAAKLSAPGTQAMYAVADTRKEHVASIDTSSGTCFCFTTPLASCLWCSTGAVRGRVVGRACCFLERSP